MDRWVPCYPGEAELCFEIIIEKNVIVTTKGGETYKGAMDVFTSELDDPDGMESISITKEHIEIYGNDIERIMVIQDS